MERRSELGEVYRAIFGTKESPPPVTITEGQVDRYNQHGIAVIRLSLEFSTSVFLVDIGPFPGAQIAYLKGFSRDAFKLIVSSGEQEPRQKHKPGGFVKLNSGVVGLRVRISPSNPRRQIPYDARLEILQRPV